MARPFEYYASILAIVSGLVLYSIGVFQAHDINAPSPDDALKFTSGLFSPGDVLAYEPINLPHDWLFDYSQIEQGWYRFEFDLLRPPQVLQSIYFPTASQNVVVYVNGVEVGNGGSLEAPIARHWPRPIMFPIAPDFFKTENNELIVLLLSDPKGRGLLPEFYLGDRALLLPAFNYRVTLKVMAPISFAIGLLILSLMLIAVTLGRTNDTQYAWGGATFLGLVGHSLPMILTQVPLPTFYWEWWQHICIGFTLVFITIFIHRFLSLHRPRLERIVIATVTVCAIGGLGLGLTGNEDVYLQYGSPFWGPLCVIIGIIPAYTIAVPAFRNRNVLNILVFGCGFMLFFFGAHDALFVLGVLSRENGYLLHYSSPLIALVYTAILFKRFVQTSKEAEDLNKHLEQRIDSKTLELKKTYERLQVVERLQVISQERERFISEMHDGLGGYLSSALAVAENRLGTKSQLATTLRDATDEMRLMIDSAEASEEDIGMVIGTLRPKIERQCKMRGFSLRWHVHETSSNGALGPALALHLVRIVQEAVNNALKHSNGDIVQITIKNGDSDSVVLEIADNGTFSHLQRTGGKGICSIEKRASMLNATSSFSTSKELGGLAVLITIPYTAFTSTVIPDTVV